MGVIEFMLKVGGKERELTWIRKQLPMLGVGEAEIVEEEKRFVLYFEGILVSSLPKMDTHIQPEVLNFAGE